MSKVTPSPAITVTTHTTIGSTLALMRRHQVGAVLVTDYQQPHQLVGIFTERDLLHWSLELQKHETWNQSIANVMTRNPTCLDLSQLEQAPEFLAQLGKRHLPITFQDAQGTAHLAGVISMRDLFYQWVEERKQLAPHPPAPPAKRPHIRVLCAENRDLLLQSRLLKDDFEVEAVLLRDDVGVSPSPAQVQIFDLDSLPATRWTEILRQMRATEPQTPIVVLYHPQHHSDSELLALDRLAQGGIIERFLKPLHVLPYLQSLRQLSASR